MARAKRARTAETPKLPSYYLRLRAPVLYPTGDTGYHVRHIRKRGQSVRGFRLYLAALNRKQLPVCHACHRDIHKGKYDGER